MTAPRLALHALTKRYGAVTALDGLTAEIEEIEERIFAGQTTRAQIEALYSLKRKLMTLDHATQPLLEVAGKLYGGRVPPICAGLHDYFRDVYDHLLRLKQSIDNLRDMVATAISVNLSLITIQENEVTKRLAAYAALVALEKQTETLATLALVLTEWAGAPPQTLFEDEFAT